MNGEGNKTAREAAEDMRFKRRETARAAFDRWCALHVCAEFCRGRDNWCPLADLRAAKHMEECRRLWAKKNGAAEMEAPRRQDSEPDENEDLCRV